MIKYLKQIIMILLFVIVMVNSIECKTNGKVNNKYVISKNGLILRKLPSIQSEKIIILPYNSSVEVLEVKSEKENINGISANWCKVKYHNYEGWAFSGYLSNRYDSKIIIEKKKIIDSIYKSSVIGDSYINKNIKLDMTLKDIENTLGKPKRTDNSEWGTVYSYNDLYIYFFDYLHELNNYSKVVGFQIPLKGNNIYYDDLLLILSKPDLIYYNEQMQIWEIIYKTQKNALKFCSKSLEDVLLSFMIFKPRENLFNK